MAMAMAMGVHGLNTQHLPFCRAGLKAAVGRFASFPGQLGRIEGRVLMTLMQDRFLRQEEADVFERLIQTAPVE